MIPVLKVTMLFVATAIAEIVGCWLVLLWRKEGGGAWLLVPAAISLAAFAWLLTLHPWAAGRTYAAYGGVYVSIAVLWLWQIEGIKPTRWDIIGVAIILAGVTLMILQPVDKSL